MEEQRKLRQRGLEMLHERVTILVRCYDDSDFRDWCATQDMDVYDFLDSELSDTAATFLTMKAVLDEYPRKEDWVKHNIRDLIAMAIESQRKTDAKSSERISWKERALAAEKECEKLRFEIEILHKHMGNGVEIGN